MRALLILSMIWAACAAGALQAESSGKNTTTVVISDGHFAGSYTVDNEGCLYIKDRDIFGVTFKKFAHHPTAKTLEEAAIQVDRANAQGAKTGDVTVKFLDVGSDNPQDYSVSNVPLTVVRNGKGAQLNFEGKTSDHVHVRVTATCDHTEEL
jgi:hypothetical protein